MIDEIKSEQMDNKQKRWSKVPDEKWGEVVARMKAKEARMKDPDSNVKKVVAQLHEREGRGYEKYGVNTDRTDLSTLEWLQHLKEELMDGAVYIEKLKNDMKEMQATQEGLLEEISEMQWKKQYEND